MKRIAPNMLHRKFVLLGVGLLTASMLMFELILIRMFSVLFLANLAFLGISVALFGLAIGGLVVFLLPTHFPPSQDWHQVARYVLAYAVSLLAVPALVPLINFGALPDFLLIPTSLLLSVPFILGNIGLTLLFRQTSAQMGVIYFSDLIGAGVGVIAAIVLMSWLEPLNVIILASLVGALASAALAEKRRWPLLLAGLAAGIFLANLAAPTLFIRFTKLGDEKPLFSKSNSFSRITVVDEQIYSIDSLPADLAPGLLPDRLGLFIDSDAYTPILAFDGNLDKLSVLNRDISSIAFQLRADGQSLIIGPGGGRDVLMALLNDHQVTAVEINPIIAKDAVGSEFADFAGHIYNHPQVNLVISEGRAFLEKDESQYSVIALPLVDTWAATSQGNMFLVEGYLYTVEAMESYLSHLESGGILSISRWNADGMRLLTLFLEASRRLGLSTPEKNVAVLGNRSRSGARLNSYLFKTEPFTKEELMTLQRFADSNGYILTAQPGPEDQTLHGQYLRTGDRQALQKTYAGNLTLATDDSPFFFFSTKLRDIFCLKQHCFNRQDGGLKMSLLIVLFMAALIMALPLLAGRHRSHQLSPLYGAIAYFSVIGLAFIFVEIALVQKFVLPLEQPIYSYSVVLASALLFAGLGSLVSQRLEADRPRTVWLVVLGIAAVAGLVLAIVDWQHSHLKLDLYWKILIAVGATAPIMALMGMLLPLGMRRLDQLGHSQAVPWCWAANGAMSVLGTVLAVTIAVAAGFNALLLIGTALYLAAPLAFSRFPTNGPKS